jgi:hypothetical protein
MCGRLSVLLQLGGGGAGGLCGRVEDVPYRNRCAKYSMPPKGSTVNGRRAMLLSMRAWKYVGLWTSAEWQSIRCKETR